MIPRIGDTVKRSGAEKRLQVRGYYKVIPEQPIEDEDLRIVMEEIIEEEKEAGTYVEQVRLAPCVAEEATIIGTGQSFYMLKDIDFVCKSKLGDEAVNLLVGRFERRLKAFNNGDLFHSTVKLRKKRFLDVC